MGKSLIIKGADFSENGIATSISWIIGFTNNQLHGERVTTGNGTLVVAPEDFGTFGLNGKTVKYIKVYAPNAGTILVHKISTSSMPYTSVSSQSYGVAQGNNIIELDTPITINSSTSIGIQGANCYTYWRNSVQGHAGWRYYVEDSTQGISAAQIPIDFGENV